MKPELPGLVIRRARRNGPSFYVVVETLQQPFYRRLTTNKYIGFGIDSKKTITCVVQKGQKEKFTTLKTNIEHMNAGIKP